MPFADEEGIPGVAGPEDFSVEDLVLLETASLCHCITFVEWLLGTNGTHFVILGLPCDQDLALGHP